jgi:hypothetical protein
MAITSTTQDGEGGAEAAGGVGASGGAEAPTRELVTGTIGDRCANCGSPLASDQRYCVECGERRGKPRFAVASNQAAPASAAAPKKRFPRPQWSSSATLVAGIATLLLAMGVGVEIGKSGNSSQKQSAGASTVVLGGSTGAAGAAASTTPTTPTTSASTSSSTGRGSTSHHSTAPIKKAVITKVVQQRAQQAASHVLGASAPKNPTVKQGGKCTGGASQGCQGGHFTGNFFGQ